MRHIFFGAAVISISLEQLEKASRDRPRGYYSDVVSHGIILGGVLFLEPAVYRNLVARYSGKPSLAKEASNLLGASLRITKAAIRGKKISVSASEISRRLEICRDCEFFESSSTRCLKCGCFLNLKTRLESEHCPIGKW